jgi:hypothetical protein
MLVLIKIYSSIIQTAWCLLVFSLFRKGICKSSKTGREVKRFIIILLSMKNIMTKKSGKSVHL